MKESSIMIILFVILFLQASWIFYDASKRGENKWLWGFFGMIQLPSSLIIYLLITRVVNKQKKCPHCLRSIKENSHYCSYCGESVK
jgi:hypothetical protein